VAVFCDLDNTLIRGASTFLAGRGLIAQGYVTRRQLRTFALDQARFILFGENTKALSRIQDAALQLLAGKPSTGLAELMHEPIYERYLAPRLFRGTIAELRRHQDAGCDVWIISATAQQIADEFVARLGYTGALATRLEVCDGKFTGAVDGKVIHGPVKAERAHQLAAQRGYDLAEAWAYSDSHNDLPLLEAVGHPVVVNPDRRLNRVAQARQWPRLRHRR
jgi:HAD superfamily hydrolase (TIGR01490 family)